MAETFSGRWSVVVVSSSASFEERLVISGSDASDGAYPGTPGSGPAQVSGQRWTVTLEWNDRAGSGWRPSALRRATTYTAQHGLVVTLSADDNYDDRRDRDYNDLVVTCTNVDPSLGLAHPIVMRYDFTVPEKVLADFRKRHRKG